MKKLYSKLKQSRFYTITFLSLMALFMIPVSTLAANDNVKNGITGAGISEPGTASALDANSFSGAVVFIITIAAIWTLACIIFAAMKISGAQGNAQKRVEGIVGLAFAGAGAWVIYNAYDIFGWFSSIGTTSFILFGM